MKKVLAVFMVAFALVFAGAGTAQAETPTAVVGYWQDGNMTKKYWVQNCQKERLGLKGKALADWRHWCIRIKPKRV